MNAPLITQTQLQNARQTLLDKKIAVLMGGHSAEREISLLTGQGVLNALRSHQLNAHAFDPATSPLQNLVTQAFDVCFIALHGRFGEDGTIQGALELMGIPYTGSGVMASSIAMDKTMTKRIWQAQGLPTPGWRLVQSATETEQVFTDLGSPMIVKPAREGSTIGLTKVTAVKDCAAAYAKASQLDPQVLCEQFIQGDEVTCPVIDFALPASGRVTPQALPVIRIVAPDGNYDYENKYFKDETKYLVPCGLPSGEEQAIQQLVLEAYQALGCKTWARADVMIDQHSRQPYLLEINTSPGMTGHSLVPMSAKAAGISYEDLCLHLLSLATLEHHRNTHSK